MCGVLYFALWIIAIGYVSLEWNGGVVISGELASASASQPSIRSELRRCKIRWFRVYYIAPSVREY